MEESGEVFLKKIGMIWESFNDESNNGAGNNKVKQIVRAISVLMSGSLQGCAATPMRSPTRMESISWTTTWWTLATLALMMVVLYLMNQNRKVKVELEKYNEVWKTIKEKMDLQDAADPCVDSTPNAREEPFSGVWYNQDASEEEERESDAVVDRQQAVQYKKESAALGVQWKRWTDKLRRAHRVSPGGDDDEIHQEEKCMATIQQFQQRKKHLQFSAEGIAEIAEGAHGHGYDYEKEKGDDDWLDRCEPPSARYQRYLQSGMDEVSDLDERVDIHYGMVLLPR